MSRKPTPATPSGTRQERRATELRRKGVGYGVEGGDVVLVVAFVQGFHVPVTSQQKRKKKRRLPILVYIKRTGKVGRLAMNDHPMMSGLSLTFFASLNSLSTSSTFHFFLFLPVLCVMA
jgi:hypothetical protein